MTEYRDAKLEAIHIFIFVASQMLAKNYLKNVASLEEYEENVSEIFNVAGEDDVDVSEKDAALGFNFSLDKYHPFIYSCSKKLACARG